MIAVSHPLQVTSNINRTHMSINFCLTLYDIKMYELCLLARCKRTCYDKFDKFIFIISQRSHTHEENTCIIILYTLWLNKKLHTCIIPCNTTFVWHADKISTKYTHIIMDTFIILLFYKPSV